MKTLLAILILSAAAHAQLGNATKLRGKPISGTAPTNGQGLFYNSTTGQYEPGSGSGGGLPDGCTADGSNGISCTGALSSGVGGSGSGYLDLQEGACNSAPGSSSVFSLCFYSTDHQPYYLDSGGTKHSLVGPAGPTGSTGPAGINTFQTGFQIGQDGGSALVDSTTQADVYANNLGVTATATKVVCYADAGSPVIRLKKNGSASNLMSSDLTCSSSGASTTSFTGSEATMADGARVDFTLVTASTAKRITVWLRYTE